MKMVLFGNAYVTVSISVIMAIKYNNSDIEIHVKIRSILYNNIHLPHILHINIIN